MKCTEVKSTVLSVDDIPDSRKLMKLTVDLGGHQRSIVAGIKKERENSNPNGARAG